jgi:hypothetical protein
MVALAGATPWPLTDSNSPVVEWYVMKTPSAAREYEAMGSTTAAAKLAATIASKAFPPLKRILIPAIEVR